MEGKHNSFTCLIRCYKKTSDRNRSKSRAHANMKYYLICILCGDCLIISCFIEKTFERLYPSCSGNWKCIKNVTEKQPSSSKKVQNMSKDVTESFLIMKYILLIWHREKWLGVIFQTKWKKMDSCWTSNRFTLFL